MASAWSVPTEADAVEVLRAVREASATGPDLVPTKLLKVCAEELAKPVVLLARRVLETERWPEPWLLHWVLPLFKKKEPWAPTNYRGVHLTSQVGKAVERLLQRSFGDHLSCSEVAGFNQYAYRKQRGARDLLALLVLTWLVGFEQGRKFCLYCSDVSGAFDRVKAERLVAKLQQKGVPEKWVKLFRSWLRARKATVIVGGEHSLAILLRDMVYQGTVWGPVLWNCFYEDARRPIRDAGFTESVYADDANAQKSFSVTVANEQVLAEGRNCQRKLHTWERANQVCFDSTKESLHVLARAGGQGGNRNSLA